jgi:hypothetical protein
VSDDKAVGDCGGSGGLTLPSPPAEKATARQDQASIKAGHWPNVRSRGEPDTPGWREFDLLLQINPTL